MSTSATPSLQQVSKENVWGGWLTKWTHHSTSTSSPMRFNVFLPPQASSSDAGGHRVPALYYLSGLTCTEDNFFQKAAPFRKAVEHGLALIAPDTSPRPEH